MDEFLSCQTVSNDVWDLIKFHIWCHGMPHASPKIPSLSDFGFPCWQARWQRWHFESQGANVGESSPAKPLQLWYLELDRKDNGKKHRNAITQYDGVRVCIFTYICLYYIWYCIWYTYSTNVKHWWMWNDFLIVMVVCPWKGWKVFFVTISLRLRTSPADSRYSQTWLLIVNMFFLCRKRRM